MLERRTDVQPDACAVGRAVEERLRQLLQFVVHLDGVDRGAVAEPCGHGQRRIPREGSDFESTLRAEHSHEHLEQFALNVPREHPRLDRPHVGFVVERRSSSDSGVESSSTYFSSASISFYL